MSQPFAVHSQRLFGTLGLIVLTGEVDIFTAPRFKECLVEFLDSGIVRLVIDLNGVTFMDSTALGVLVGGVRRVHDAGGAMTLVVTSRPVERVLSITGLDRVFDVHKTREAAVEALA